MVVLFGAAIALVPAERLSRFLFPPVPKGPIVYPRTRVANTKDLAIGESLLFEYPEKERPAILIGSRGSAN
jgi:hypothetical protein